MILEFYKIKDCKILNVATAYQTTIKMGIPSFSLPQSSNDYNGTPIYGDNIEIDKISTFDKIKKYDYLFFDGYDDIENSLKKLKNIFVDTIVLSHSGEFMHTWELEKINQSLDLLNINYNRKIVLSPLEEYKEKAVGWEMFLYPFAGLRFFQHFANNTANSDIYERETILGLEWSDTKKQKLFSCLVGEGRPARKVFVRELKKSEIANKGYTTWGDNKMLDSKHQYSDRFKIQPEIAKDSYIEIQLESVITDESTFITEKAAKPFLGLQFPIFYAHIGYIQYFREWGFDMFDDIIDHSYDSIPIGKLENDYGFRDGVNWSSYGRSQCTKKSKMIIKELEKLSKLDIHQTYIECKDRLLNNQQRLFELVHEDNDRHQEMAKFVFGDIYGSKEINLEMIQKQINHLNKSYILKKYKKFLG